MVHTLCLYLQQFNRNAKLMKVISSMKMRRVIALLGILTLTLGVATEETESEFNNDRRLIEEETGGILLLKSRGKLTKIVDLDSTEVVKVTKSLTYYFICFNCLLCL